MSSNAFHDASSSVGDMDLATRNMLHPMAKRWRAMHASLLIGDVFWANPLGIVYQQTESQGVYAVDECLGGALADVSDAFYGSWSTLNTSVATVDHYGTHTGTGVGSTTSHATGKLNNNNARQLCPLFVMKPSGPDNVAQPTGFQISVVTSSPSGTTNSVISKTSRQIKVTAINLAGIALTSYTGTITLSSTDTQAVLPASYTYTAADNGSHTFNVTLVTVNFTSSTRDLTVKDSAHGVSSAQNIYVWFNVIASDEGLVGGTTAYGHVITPNDHFVALPSTGLANVPVVLIRNTTQQSTTVLDVGPWCPHAQATTGNPCVCASDPYWSTSGVPYAATNSCSSDHAGIDLADGTFSDLGLTGNGNIYWRFQ